MDSASAALLEGAAATPSKGKDRASVEHLAEEGADDDSSDEEEEAEEDDAIEEDVSRALYSSLARPLVDTLC